MSIFSGVNNPGVALNQFTSAQYASLLLLVPVTDPGINAIMVWDHTDVAPAYATIGSGLTYTHATHTLTASTASAVTVGTTTIASGTDTRVLFDNAGVLGEYTISGSVSVAMTTSPTFVTPTLGAASATSINRVAITAPATSATLTIANSQTLTVNGSTTLTNGTHSGTNTGDNTVATSIASRTLWGQTYDGTANVSGSLTAVGNITGGASNMTIVSGTGASRTMILQTTTAGSTATTALTLGADQSATFAGHLVVEGVTSTGATGSGKFVFDGTPTLVTPVLGVATATSINGNTFTTGTYTLTGQAGKTLTFNGTITLTGTDAQTYTFPTTTATLARTDAGQTFTGVNVFTSPKIITQISDTNGNILVNIGATASAVNYVKVTNAATGTAGPILAADGETNVDLKIAAKGTGKVHRTTGEYGDITAYSPAGGATATLTLNTSNIHTITMPAGNATIALSNEGVGQCFIINIIQDSVGSRTVTWFTTIKWAGGSAPTLTTTANKIDTLGFIVTSAGNYQGYVVGQNL